MFLFLFLLFPVGAISFCFLAFFIILLHHINATFSHFGRVLQDSGAMGAEPIMDTKTEVSMSATELTDALWQTATSNQGKTLAQLYPQVALSAARSGGQQVQRLAPSDNGSSMESLVDLESGLLQSSDATPLVSKVYSSAAYQSTSPTTSQP